MQPSLTEKQQRVLAYLQKEIMNNGQAPSLRQAATDMGVSHAAIAQIIRALEDKGYLKREGRYSRTVYLLNRARETSASQRWQEVPIIGRVMAGLPMYAQTEWDGSTVLDTAVFRGQNLFALHVKGDSMKDVGILNGLQQGTGFFASTSLLAIGGCFALLNSTERILQIATHLGLPASNAPVLWEIKVLGLTLIFAYAFFKFGWAYRLFNYTTILVGATPDVTRDEPELPRLFAAEAGDLMVQAGIHFNRGQRAFFFSIGEADP